MVSEFVSESSISGLSPGREHFVVFLGKTLYSNSASLRPGVYMGTVKLKGGGGGGGVEILLVASCYGNPG